MVWVRHVSRIFQLCSSTNRVKVDGLPSEINQNSLHGVVSLPLSQARELSWVNLYVCELVSYLQGSV